MKKLSFFLMAMLMSIMSFAETYTHTFVKGEMKTGSVTLSGVTWNTAADPGTTAYNWDGQATAKGIQIGTSKAPCKSYTFSTSHFVDYMVTNITVNASTASDGTAKMQVSVGGVDYIAQTALTKTATNYTGSGASQGDVVISFTNTSKAFYIKSISITYQAVSAGEGMILVDQSNVDFGKITKTQTITVTGQNLTSLITAQLQDGSNFSVEGTLTAEGGVLTVNFTATEAGKYNDVLVLTSGDVTAEVTLSGEVLILEGQGTKEAPYTVADVIALGLADKTLAWVEGYIIGALNSNNNNALETTGTSVASNILLADAANETQNYIPVALPNNSESRKALNLVDNPNNLGAKVAVYGTLETYFSKAGVKEVSDYEWVVAPVVNHTITVSANPAEAGTIEGLAEGGKYEHGATATLTATPAEGYEFVCWTEGADTVSTEAEYGFVVLADRNLVANFVEAAPEINYEEFIMSNLVVTTPAEGLEMLEASDPVNGISVMLGVYEDGTLHEDCLITFQGMELSIVSSEKVTKEYNEDVETDVYTVRVVVAFGGANMGLQLLMYATAAAEPIIINVEGATVTLTEYQISAEETAYELNMISNWVYEEDGLTYEVECLLPTFDPTKESGDYEASFFVRGEGNAFGMTEDAIVSVAKNGNQITLTGEITAYNNNVYNVTISGTLPVVEPTTITWELNGGEFPAVEVPTQDSLIAAFKDGYNAYFGVSVATTRVIDNFLYAGAAVNNPTCDVSLFMKDDASPWKWLGDYVLAVTNAQIEAGLLVTLKELATELMWRQSLTGFFLQQAKLDSNYKGNADFTEAGKPEAWGAAYQAAHAVVLPTEPVAEDYTLPTPIKEGYTFVGWYDNAAGEGEAMTVLPAGWAGTLYAIWKQDTTTALDNIAVEGKAVKAIINGQVIIIKNGVQYNAQGQVVK